KKAGYLLNVHLIEKNTSQSVNTLAKLYSVPRSTLKTRLRGTSARYEIRRVDRKLSPSKELTLI
ncbi:hypothetical protein CC78DRAFT_482708, partial [Lojkania enalia]